MQLSYGVVGDDTTNYIDRERKEMKKINMLVIFDDETNCRIEEISV